MNKIYKYQLKTTNIQDVQLPVGSEILCIQSQFGNPCIWALVNPYNELETRTFEIFGTGNTIYYDMGVERKYIGTYQVLGGDLVFHCFERIS